MNKLITIITISLLFSSLSFAKEVKVDIDAKRTESAYVNLSSPDIIMVDNTNWDLAFMTPLSAAIRINDGQGVRLWHVTDAGISDFDSPLDTTGKFETWTELFNSTDSWQIGAFNMGLDGFSDDNPGEFGWGQYSQTIVSGTELFVIKLRNGEYKKIAIDELTAGTFYFFYSDLNNENQVSKEYVKTNFSGKLHGYYDLQIGESVDREPTMDKWHLEFSKYVQIVEGQGVTQPYPVVGVRSNRGVKVAQLDDVDVVNTPEPKPEEFSSIITEIGHDWKELNFSTFEYEVIENRVYFVQRFELQQINGESVEVPVGELYKLVFTGFEGGTYTFEIADPQLSVNETNYDNNKFAVYPNVLTKNETINLVYAGTDIGHADLKIYSSTGAVVHNQNINLSKNLQISSINTADLNSGVYFVRIQKGNSIYTQKFVVR